MAVQRITEARGATIVEATAIRRLVAVIGAVIVEAILIASVVLSSIGVSPTWHPTPGGPAGVGPVPAPTVSH
jgi:hypothetical protein